MIRIVKPINVPRILAISGKKETAKNCRLYTRFKQEFQTGKRTFEFKKEIYGHTSVKDVLEAAQHHKCCFCERREEIGDVEHFRPKSAYQQQVGDALSPIGYYWLVYEWRNLFFVCPTCNRSYKKNLFPLVDPTKRAKSHTDNLADETPLFIHPQDDNPEEYIEFIGNTPRAINGNQKGKITIQSIGIDREFLQDRRSDHYEFYKRLFEIQLLIEDLLKTVIDQTEKQKCQNILADTRRQLSDAQKDEAEFASMIRCAFRNNFKF